MKQSNRILAYSALALVVMLAAFGAIAFDTSNVAYAQGTVPDEPTLTATASGADTINLDMERRRHRCPLRTLGLGQRQRMGPT